MNARECTWIKMRLAGSLLLVSIGLIPGQMVQSAAAKESSLESRVSQQANLNDPEYVSALNPQVEAELLEQTIQIKIFQPLLVTRKMGYRAEFAHKEYLVTSGLGSLVVWQQKYVLVTHNHWGEVLDHAEYVQFLDWQGKLLRTMDLKRFMSLILYNDLGTMVLYDPTASWVGAGHLGENQNVVLGDVLVISHQDPHNPGKVALMRAEVVEQHQNNGLAVIGVSVLDNRMIMAGDSGGGAWLDGKLVGNMWAVVTNGDRVDSSSSGLVAQLPKISIESIDDDADIPDAKISLSSAPQMR